MHDTGTYELNRQALEWVPLAYFQDRITARMNAAYLEAAKVEARVLQEGDQFRIEVPEDQFGRASQVCDPMEKPGAPPLQESGGATGIHALLRDQMKRVETVRRERQRSSVASRVILIALLAIAAAALLIFLV